MATPAWDDIFGAGASAQAAPVDGGPPSQDRKRGSGSHDLPGARSACEELEKKVNRSLKMAIINEQYARQLFAATTRSAPLSIEGEYFRALSKASTNYTAQTKGKKGHIKRANRALKLCLLYVDNPVRAINKHQTGREE